MNTKDIGLTHVAFIVGDIDASTDFYRRYANMEVVDQRREGNGATVAWLSDSTRPFVLVLLGIPSWVPGRRLVGKAMARAGLSFSHLGVGVGSTTEVDALADQARTEGLLQKAPVDAGPPVGYFTFIRDPDGNTLEIAYGQEVGFTVESFGKS